MNRREFLKGAAALALAPAAAACGRGRRPVNLLLFTLDDVDRGSPGCYGGPVRATPHFDRLAAQGMRFLRGHVNIAVCRPSRAVMLTGLYPHRNGVVAGGPIRAGVPVLTDWLREAGYRVGILGKVDHLEPVARFGWDLARDGDALGAGRDPALYGRFTGEFIQSCAREGRPFFLMANAHDAHRPFAGSPVEVRELGAGVPAPSQRFGPDEVPVPPFLPDLLPIRRELAGYFTSLHRADDTLGAVLAALDRAGVADDTLVVAISDNGMSFPYAKTNCYLQSTCMPWVVRWPGRVAPGAVESRHLVSGVDLAPTLLEAAGLSPPDGLDGRSFVPLLAGGSQAGRERLVTVMHRTWSPKPLEMRCLREGDLAYTWNAWSNGRRRFASESQRGLSWHAMERAAKRRPDVAERVRFFLYRTPDELYDEAADPASLVNLAGSPDRQQALERLRGGLLAWLEDTGDPLAPAFREHLARATAGPSPAASGA